MMDTLKLRNHNIAYYTLLALLTIDSAIRNSQVLYPIYQMFEQAVIILIVVLMFGVICTARMKKVQFVLLMIMEMFGVLIYLKLGRMFFLYLINILFFCADKDIEKTGRIMLRILSGIFSFNIICTVYFWIFDRSKLYIRTSILEPRPQLDLSCGGHPNHAACLFVFITCIFFYLHIEELKKRYFIGLILMTIIMYIIIGSEALFVIFLLPIIWNYKDNKTVMTVLRKIVKYGIPIILAVSLILMWSSYIPGLSNVAEWMNNVSSGRFGLSIEAMNRYPLTFLGANTEFGHLQIRGEDIYVYADNAYVYMLINAGIIYLVFLGVILFLTAQTLEIKEIVIILVYLGYGLAESNILSFTCIFPLIVAVHSRWGQKIKSTLKS